MIFDWNLLFYVLMEEFATDSPCFGEFIGIPVTEDAIYFQSVRASRTQSWPPDMYSSLSGGFLAALAAFTWATAIVLSKVSLMEEDAVTIFTVQIIAATAGALQYYLAFYLYLMALRHIAVNVAGTMLYLIPVFTLAFAYVFLGETLAPIQLTGCGVIPGAVALINHRHAA